MIELSKCPNCASEDKVTIAGKDFCMRCGTPATEQPASTTTPASTNEASTNQAMGQPVGTLASVAKFNEVPATNPTPESTQPPVPNQDPSAVPTVAMQPPAGNAAQPPTEIPAQQAPVANQVPEAPSVLPTQPQPQLQQQAIQQPVQIPMQPQSQPQMQPSTGPITPNTNNVPTNQTVTEALPALEPTPSSVPTSITDTNNLQQQAETIPAPIPPAAIPTPEPTQIATDLPLTQAATIAPKTNEAQVEAPKIHTHQAIMSLDKNDSGVFSDEQLDELGKNMSDPSEPINPPSNHSRTLNTDIQHSSPTTFHTDIRPPVKEVQTNQNVQSAVNQAVEKDIKVPNKDSKTKKALKPAGIALSIVALFLVGAYIWQVNYPTLAFKIASAKAGMSATMPGYIPGGYKLAGEIQTNPGSVSYSLVNGGQSKKISITQTKTDWDSQALAESYVAPKAENYLALQAQGLTIYMLGDSQATWVNKGTWYKIESPDQSLSQDQAIKIATSL